MILTLGHSSGNESLTGRLITALKSSELLNESVGAGYIQRKWPPAHKDSGAWPLSGLRQSFLNGALTRLFDPESVLKIKIVEFVRNGDFGLASRPKPNGEYDRIWFKEEVSPEEVTFDSGVVLVLKDKAERLTKPTIPGTGTAPPTARPFGSA